MYKYSALLLFLIMLAAALTETLGLGMVMPLLEVITNPTESSSGSLKFLSPILGHFPNYYGLLVIGALLVVLVLLKNILIVCRTAFSSYFTHRFQRLWQSAIMKKYMYAEYPFLLSNKQGVLLNNLLLEPARAAKSLHQLIGFFSRAILAFFLYGLLLLVNWKITFLITFVAMIVIFLMRRATYNYALGVGKKKMSLSQQLSALGAENISAIRQIKIFSLENEVCRRFARKLNNLIRILVRFRIVRSLPHSVTESLVVIGIVGTLVYIYYFIKLPLANIIPVLGLFIVISQKFFPTLSSLFTERMSIFAFLPSLKLVYGLYTTSIEQEELGKGIIIDQLKEDLVFDDIHFSYTESKPLFKSLNIRIPKGKVTAIVGPSGSGKTTITDLLIGLFRKKSGRILINGFDITEINLLSWRRLVGYISQDTFLFNTSVRENILVGRPDASEREVVVAARGAHADEFIRGLPKGYDTILGDRGLKISGGQRQRVAIARAIIGNPEVLIFDEATSSIDPESERLIYESINELAKQKTVILISYRLSTVKGADLIYVLNNGGIVEAGKYEDLIFKDSGLLNYEE